MSLVDAASQRECAVMLIDNNSAASMQKAMHARTGLDGAGLMQIL